MSVLHGEGSPLRKCNDPCTSRRLKGRQTRYQEFDFVSTKFSTVTLLVLPDYRQKRSNKRTVCVTRTYVITSVMSSEAVGRNVSVDAALRTAVAIALVSAKRKRAAAAAAADGSQWKQQAEQLQLEALRLRESAAALFGAWRELRPLSQQQQQGGPDPLARQIEQAEEDQEAAEPVAAAKAGKKAKRGGRQRGSGRRATRPKADPRVNEAGAGPGQGAGPEAATGGDGGAAVSFIDTVADAGGAAAAWDGRAAAMAAVGEGLLALLGPTPLAGVQATQPNDALVSSCVNVAVA